MSPLDAQLTLGLAEDAPDEAIEPLGPGAVVLRGFALTEAESLVQAVEAISAAAPFRHMETPGGRRMSVALTGCGALGWVSDRAGYRYTARDPSSGERWPPMPGCFRDLARAAAAEGGFPAFEPDACLVNQYLPGARLSLHQDKDERDFGAPIVSVSLGLPAVFLFGGAVRGERPARVPLRHGDVVVWGGPARLRFHGVAPLCEGHHPRLGARRVNLTFRVAG